MKKNTKIIIAVALVVVLAVAAYLIFGRGSGKQPTATEIAQEFENVGNIKGTMETDVTLTVDEAAITELAAGTGSAGGIDQIVKPIVSIVNNLKFRLLSDSEQIQLDLMLKDTSLATIGGKKTEDGNITLVTDLLPGFIIKADPAKLTAQTGVAPTAGATGMTLASLKLTDEERKAITDAAKAKVTKFDEDLKAKAGEVEKGSWTFDGATFTEKKPVNATTKEMLVMTLNLVKDLYTDPSMKKITDAMGEKFDITKLDEAIANTEKKPDSEFPAMTWVIYTNGAGNEYHEVTLEKDKTKVAMAFSLIGKKLAVHGTIDADGKGTIEGVLDAEKLTANITVDIDSKGTVAGLAFNLQAKKDGSFTGTMNLSMNGKKLLGLNIDGKASSEKMSVSFDESGKKVVSVEALSDNSSAEGKEVLTALSLSLPGILQKAMGIMPDEINSLMTLFGGAK